MCQVQGIIKIYLEGIVDNTRFGMAFPETNSRQEPATASQAGARRGRKHAVENGCV